ncbi:hypothetical protein V8E36_000056 [Tilletia maclaganii]
MQLSKSLSLISALLLAIAAAGPIQRLSGALEPRLLASPPGLPSVDSFYKPPSSSSSPFQTQGGDWTTMPNGSILKSRSVTPTSGQAASAYQLLYKTTDAIGTPDTTVVTILVPKTPKSPAQIVGLQLPQDSVSLDCAPSAGLVSSTKSPAALGMAVTNQGQDGSLKNGYYVVIPDHEGSRAASFVGPTEGRAVLDGLLAATSYSKAIPGVSRDTKIVLGGYSGGAHATAWATQLYPKYAPSLKLTGQVVGGLPVNLTNTLLFLNKGIYAGFAAVGVVGEYLAYPDIKAYIDQYLNQKGRELFDKLTTKQQCLLDVVVGYGGTDLFALFNKANPLDHPIPKKRLEENRLGNDNAKLTIPTIMYHGTADDIIPYKDAVDYAKVQCRKGSKVHFYPAEGKQHIPEELGSGDDMVKWLDQLMQGTADTSCNVDNL